MRFDRPAAKQAARESMRLARPNPVLVTLVYLVIVALVGVLIAYSTGGTVRISVGGHVFYTYRMSTIWATGIVAQLLRALWWLFTAMMSFGYLAYALYVSRRQEAGYGDLLLGFSDAARVIVLNLLMALFIMLWTLLFVIPGIMAAYSYRMAPYLLLDYPEIGARGALGRSKEMMRGHRWELFVCDLSFFGWALLSALTFGILAVWVTPYQNVTIASFYDALAYDE